MSELSIGVRQLKSRLSEYLRQVKAGRTIIITERGQPVGRIVPAAQSRDEKIQAMIDAGLLSWSGKKWNPPKPKVRVRGKTTIADLVIENRE